MAASGFDRGRFGGDGDGLALCAEIEGDVEDRFRADGKQDLGILKGSKIGAAFDAKLVFAGNEADDRVVAILIDDRRALGAGDGVCQTDFGAGDSESLRIRDGSG